MELIKIVIRYADGRLIKGYTNDFFPNKPVFRVRPADAEIRDRGVEVSVMELKAVFFVKDFVGNSAYNEKQHFAEGQRSTGRRVEVTFVDGEVLVGSTLGYDPNRLGFFVIPADQGSNNSRIFVVSANVSKFRYL